MNYSSRFFLYAPLLAFLSLAAWAMGYWWVVASALDKKLIALNGHEVLPGITVSYTSKTISGFPFNIDLVFTNLKIAGAGAHGPFAWQAENFALHTLTYGPRKYIYEAAGQQHLAWTDGAGVAHHADFLPGTLRASAQTDQKGLSRFDLEVDAVAGINFTAAHFQFHLRRDPDDQDLDLMASADNLMVGSRNFDSGIETLRVYATLTQASAFAPLLRGQESFPNADAHWRAQGGILKPDHQKTVVKLIGVGDEAQSARDALIVLNPLY